MPMAKPPKQILGSNQPETWGRQWETVFVLAPVLCV